jgi:hypothetical protein
MIRVGMSPPTSSAPGDLRPVRGATMCRMRYGSFTIHITKHEEIRMDAINIPEVVAEVTEAHRRYERALTTNDFDTLDELFWNDPKTLRFGPNGTLVGHGEISSFRRSRTSEPPQRIVQHLHVTTFGREFAVTNQESKRQGDGKITRQSQTWIRRPEGWRIICAHVSDLPSDRHK